VLPAAFMRQTRVVMTGLPEGQFFVSGVKLVLARHGASCGGFCRNWLPEPVCGVAWSAELPWLLSFSAVLAAAGFVKSSGTDGVIYVESCCCGARLFKVRVVVD